MLVFGTDTPNAKLEIIGDLNQTDLTSNPMKSQLIVGDLTQQRLYIGSYYQAGVYQSCAIQSSDLYQGSDIYSTLLLNPKGGNVGIGTSTPPTVKLDVAGSIKFTGDLITSSNTISQAELGHLDEVSENIQTQLDGKQADYKHK